MTEKGLECDVLVIGGGPAGMMAAIAASAQGAKTVLLERNSELGIKLMMTGKGRCNITNAEKDKRKFLEAFGRNGKFLYTAFNDFGPQETINFFNSRRLPTKAERGGRIFPVSDKAEDVRGVLFDELRKNKVRIMKDIQVSDLVTRDKKIIGIKLKDSKTEIGFKNIIIATGGLSYPYSGSSGDGFRWAEKVGQKVTAPRPALTPVRLEERWVGELEGLSLKNVRIGVYRDNKKQDERFGEAIFTDDGMSGPIVLDMSKKIGELLSGGKVKLIIDYKPALTFAELDLRVQKDFIENQNRMFKNALDELLPQKLIPAIIRLSGIDAEKKVNLVTKEERKKLVHLLKEMEVNVRGVVGFDKAVITSGGVSLRETDPKTMKSKNIDNLYFAGEVLDLDAPTGGYNLQEAWSTGHLAGKSAGTDN